MALTAEQQSEVDKLNAIEDNRSSNIAAQEAKRAKLDALRMAKDILVENARSKPVEERDITADAVVAFATTLVAYANS
jgi:hypothetical protein